jgi:hypothetical protein
MLRLALAPDWDVAFYNNASLSINHREQASLVLLGSALVASRLMKLGGYMVTPVSARMDAATGDLAWEQRYRHFELMLDEAIKKVIKLVPDAYSGKGANETDAANLQLVEIEHRAFDLPSVARRAG